MLNLFMQRLIVPSAPDQSGHREPSPRQKLSLRPRLGRQRVFEMESCHQRFWTGTSQATSLANDSCKEPTIVERGRRNNDIWRETNRRRLVAVRCHRSVCCCVCCLTQHAIRDIDCLFAERLLGFCSALSCLPGTGSQPRRQLRWRGERHRFERHLGDDLPLPTLTGQA
jgi:hypothetical protein